MSYEFQPLNAEHCPIIFEWLKQPHIAAFWQDPTHYEDFKKKYLIEKPSRSVFGFMIRSEGEYLGYIQYYSAQKVGGGWWPEATEATYGIDLMIGSPLNTSRGFGSKILKQFLQEKSKELILEHAPKFSSIEWIADPDPSNLIAIHCFEKVGFKNHGNVQTPYGEAVYMTLNSQSFTQ